MDATEILERAADILAERGVHRGDFVNPETGVEACSSGALCLAIGANVYNTESGEGYALGGIPEGGNWVYLEAYNRLQKAMDDRPITAFNDDPANSDEDIILCFKRAAHDG